MSILKNYTGNKGMPGLWQFIINRIPPHEIYYELFAGSGTIARILPDHIPKILVDLNEATCRALQDDWDHRSGTVNIICGDALQIISSVIEHSQKQLYCRQLGPAQSGITVPPGTRSFRKLQSKISVAAAKARTDRNNCTDPSWPVQTEITVPARKIMIYADPPYMFSTRRSQRRLYEKEMTDADHKKFLRACSTVKANCMISHPENDLYDKYLRGWTKEKFKVSYHGQVAEECIYYNYPKPEKLQTYDYVGADCWDRQRVKRKIERLARKLAELPALERNAVISRAIK